MINEVQKISGVDLNEVKSSKDIAVAMGALEKIRFEGISTDDT